MEKCKFIFIIGNDKQAFNELIQNLIYYYDGYKQSENYFIIRLDEYQLKNKELLYSLIKSHTLIFHFSGTAVLSQVYTNYSHQSLTFYQLSTNQLKNMNIIDSENQNDRRVLLNKFLDQQLHQFKQTLSEPESIQLLAKCYQQIQQCYFISHSQFYDSIQCNRISEDYFFEIMKEKEYFENFTKMGKNHNSRAESKQRTLKESQFDQSTTLKNNKQQKLLNQEIHQCQIDENNCQPCGDNRQTYNISSENNVQQFSESNQQQGKEKNSNEEKKQQELMRSNYQNQSCCASHYQKSQVSKNEFSIKQNNKPVFCSEIVSNTNNQMSEIQKKKRNQVVGDLKILLVSIEEIQDQIFKPKQTKYKKPLTNKFEILNVNGCNLKFFKSPLFQTENDEIILQFKSFFQKNQVNIILFCITIQRNDIMKQRIDKMVTKFVGVSRAQLGIIIYNPYQQLTDTEQDYLKHLKSRLKFQFFCLVNQDDTEAQILDKLLDQFQDITPQNLDLKETEFAEETEEDKRQQKKLELSLFSMQLQQILSQIQSKQNIDNKYIQEIKDEDQKIQELKKLLYQSEQNKKEKEYRRKEVKYEIDTLQTKYDNLRKKIQYKY